jgi:signal transduction histidine kinase
MPLLFWLDVVALSVSTVIATSLALIVLGARPGRALNRSFGFFTLVEAAWATASLLVRLTLWLKRGNPLLLSELAALAFALLGPSVLIFAARYVSRRTRWSDLSVTLGLVAIAIFSVPLFRHQLFANPYLDADGAIVLGLSAWGVVATALLAAYIVCSLILLCWGLHRTREPYVASSVLIMIVGFVASIVLRRYLVVSLTNALSLVVLSYAVVGRQILNPLQELTANLRQQVEEHAWELEHAHQEVQRSYEEVESWVDERIAELEREIAERRRVEAERAVLLDALQHRSTQLQTAAEVSKSASMILDPEELIGQTVRLIQERFSFYYVGLFLLDEAGEYAVLQAGTGEAARQMLAAGHKLRVGGPSMIGWCTAHGRARIALDVGEEAIRFDNPFLPHTHSEMALPLISRGRCIGALTVQSTETAAFSQEDVAILQTMADQVAISIQNAWLLEAERRRGEELESLRQASLHLTSTLELQPVLEAIIEHVIQLVSADNTHIFFYDGKQLTFGAAMWGGALQRESYAEPRPRGLTYTVARSGEPIVIPDVDAHPFFRERRWGGAIASLPLQVEGEVRGVMNVAFDSVHVFGENELNVLKLLADQAAIAIHNARLHQQVRSHADELSVALARQAELDRLKGHFIQNVSHELRSPLGLIRGYAEMLGGGDFGELPPAQGQAVSIIVRRTQMLSDLVEDITLILEAEARPLARQEVALDELARTAVEDFRVTCDQADLSLQAEIAADLLPVSGSIIYLRRVLDNLLSNAIKFTPAGGTITVRVWQQGDQVALAVRDTGIGIPSDQLERVFERFYQVDGSTRRRYGGVGLGLALVKEIVERHSGQVRVESKVDKGSEFIVTLPACRTACKPSS